MFDRARTSSPSWRWCRRHLNWLFIALVASLITLIYCFHDSRKTNAAVYNSRTIRVNASPIVEEEKTAEALIVDDVPYHNLTDLQHPHTPEEQENDDKVHRLARNNLIRNKYLILAIANHGNLDFTLNWIESLRRTNHDKYLVMCLDDVICKELDPAHSARVPSHWLQKEIESSALNYGTSAYVNLVQSKTLVVVPFFRMGFTVLFSDVDIVWLNSRMVPYLEWVMKDNKHYEALFSVDQTADRVPSINSGFWFAKPTKTVVDVFDRTVALQIKRNATQQSAMNVALSESDLKTGPKIGFLDKMIFPNGWVYFRTKFQQTTGIAPYILHANYMKGAHNKRESLRAAGHWYLDENNRPIAQESRDPSLDVGVVRTGQDHPGRPAIVPSSESVLRKSVAATADAATAIASALVGSTSPGPADPVEASVDTQRLRARRIRESIDRRRSDTTSVTK